MTIEIIREDYEYFHDREKEVIERKLAKQGKHTIMLDGREIELWIGRDTLSLVAPENTKLMTTIPYIRPQTFAHKEISIQIKD